MERSSRLRRHSDFSSVRAGLRVFSGDALVAFARPGPGPNHRIGVTVSRGIRSAVERNRVRRRLRAVARTAFAGPDSPLTRGGIPYDVVLIGRPAALSLPFDALQAEADDAALKLSVFA